ncbi:hypothetical protein A9K72_30980 [Mesorhizobium loti]|nr:hypothetical protein A9174_32390 [Mesorhizobium loti NZP2037]OBP85604.1 hypothetical protein BAE41_27155 [Mesorhizobium loti]OBP96954.1 hypothetical protein BAE38_27080 [Mesorhizobium loti]OBQ73532.1 hypothetical protein A9K72_30980 [Mesorhizobium loti]
MLPKLYSLPLAAEGHSETIDTNTRLNQNVETLARALEDRSVDSFPALAIRAANAERAPLR